MGNNGDRLLARISISQRLWLLLGVFILGLVCITAVFFRGFRGLMLQIRGNVTLQLVEKAF